MPKEFCQNMVTDIEKNNSWEQHTWQNYGKLIDRKPKFPSEELDIAESFPNQNESIFPYLGEALKKYENTITENNSFNPYKANCGLHIACPVRFNRYNTHTLMLTHHDHIHSLFDGERKGIPVLSIVGLLNDDFEGGEFVFFDDYEVTLTTGDILIFPSVFMFPHRVQKIKKGKRYSFVSWAW